MIIRGAKDFTKYCAAIRAFENCLYFISLLHQEDDLEHRSALWGAACVNYRRPFGKNGEFGKIKSSLVPVEHKELHASLKDQRDDFFAHSNSRAKADDNSQIHQVSFVVDDHGVSVRDQFALPSDDAPEQLKKLTTHLIDEISTAHKEYLNKNFSGNHYDAGEYVLDWDLNKLIKSN
jgi:hypothetical protein